MEGTVQCRDLDNLIGLASSSVRTSNSCSVRQEYKNRQGSGNPTKSRRPCMVIYIGDPRHNVSCLTYLSIVYRYLRNTRPLALLLRKACALCTAACTHTHMPQHPGTRGSSAVCSLHEEWPAEVQTVSVGLLILW